MATSRQLNDVECEKNPGHTVFIPLSEFTTSDLLESHRSLHNWALICTIALLSVRLEVKTTGPGAVDGSGGGCIVGVDDSHTDKVILTVQTAAHLGYDIGKETTTTLFLFIPGTGEVLESSDVELKTIKKVDDIAILSVTFDKHSCADPKINHVLSYIQDALRPNFDTFFQFVLRKYQTVPFPLSCFLKNEIRCIKSLKFVPGKVDVLEIELRAAQKYLIDVNLFISAFVSHDYNLLEVMGEIANGSDINTDTECLTVPAVNKQFSPQKTKLLNSLKTALCIGPLDENIMSEVGSYLKLLLPFDISVQLKCSTIIVMRVGLPNSPEGAEIANGNREMMRLNMKAQKDDELNSMQDCELGSKLQEPLLTGVALDANNMRDAQPICGTGNEEQDSMLTDEALGANIIKDAQSICGTGNEEQDSMLTDEALDANNIRDAQPIRGTGSEEQDSMLTDEALGANGQVQASSRKHSGSKTQITETATQLTSEVLNAQSGEGDDSIVVDAKIAKKRQIPTTLAALISYPHNLQQPYVTLGYVEKITGYGEVFYTTPSCPGSSGSPAWLIKRIPSAGAELKDISFATHSSSDGSLSVGVLLLPNNQE